MGASRTGDSDEQTQLAEPPAAMVTLWKILAADASPHALFSASFVAASGFDPSWRLFQLQRCAAVP